MIAVVDLDRVTANCNACKTASAALTQPGATRSRPAQQTLAAPLETERQVDPGRRSTRSNGKEPDAALQARVKAFQTKRQQAQQELARQQEQIQRNQAYIQKQIADKLGPIYQQVMQQPRRQRAARSRARRSRRATSVDVTNDVLAALNSALPTIATTAPGAAQQPQGR